jgi:crotonobetainyl-CoA:carnitine CoA-transferase CaiB-like acyl-CoA transferase
LALNPRLIICSISGFGRSGPWSDLPGYDFAIQAMSGFMDITGPVEGPPSKAGVAVTDVLTGLHAAVAVLACLQARQRSGHGYTIDLALLECAVASQVNLVQAFLTSGKVPARQGNAHLQIVPYELFATADSWLVLAVGNDGQWQRFCQAAGQPEWTTDPRFATNEQRVHNRLALVPLLQELMRRKTTDQWLAILRGINVPHAPVLNYAELFGLPHAEARSYRVTVRDHKGRPVDLLRTPFHIAGTSLPIPTAPPEQGEHTNEVLRELLGLDNARLVELRGQGVI